MILELFERRQSPENPSTNLSDPDAWFWNWAGASPTHSGKTISEASAMRVIAVYACVRILAESVASLPLILYRRRPDGGKERATDHPYYRLLHDSPNPWNTSFGWRETIQGHAAIRGNGYNLLERARNGRIVAIWPMMPTDAVPELDGRQLWYRVDSDMLGVNNLFPASDVLHISGLTGNSIEGYSPIRQAREALGLAMAAEQFGASWFGNGSRVAGVLEHPGKVRDDAIDRLRASWEAMYKGVSNSHKVAILEQGMTWKQIGIPPEDAQFLETRKFQVQEIARLFRIPPHMLADLDRATFSNIEHQSLEFVIHTLRPWLVRWEQELNRKLLVGAERDAYYFEFLVDGLLRGDLKTRYEAYAVAVNSNKPWLSKNEIRRIENLNPVEGGDELDNPQNNAGITVEEEATP